MNLVIKPYFTSYVLARQTKTICRMGCCIYARVTNYSKTEKWNVNRKNLQMGIEPMGQGSTT